MNTEGKLGIRFGGGRAGGAKGNYRAGRLGRFARDEQGSFVVFSLYLLIAVFLVAGVAVDVVRYEAQRTRLQNTLDRAILAAADMSQSLDAETVVNSYFDKAGLSGYLSNVTPSSGFNTKTVSATGSGVMDTFFMGWLGIDHLDPYAAGTAEESISDIEISMVLDVSGSMGEYIYETVTYQTRYGSRTYQHNTGETKLEALQDAAKEFVDTIFAGTTNGRTSMSIVPYASQVNAGADLLSHFNVSNQNTVNTCVDFTTAQFDTTAISSSTALTRSDYFDKDSRSAPPSNPAVCNTSAYTRVIPLGGDAQVLKDAIDAFEADGNTSVEIGIKWGAALLDPAAQDVVSAMIVDGDINNSFQGRPYSFGNSDTMKVLVVMTDGINTNQYVLEDNFKGQPSGVYRWWNGSAWRYSVNAPEGSGNSFDGDGTNNETYRRLNITSGSSMWASTPEGGASATQLTFQELWSLVSIDYNAYYFREGAYFKDPWGSHSSSSSNSNRISSTAASKGDSAYSAWDNEPDTYIGPDTKNTRMLAVCDAVKDTGIIVFSIGFEVTDDSADLLEDCASSSSHFYRVEGLQITTAFQSIANAIGKLRLTQ